MHHVLPQVDAGGPGPRIESWAFAIDQEGLDLVTAAGVYHLRTCKLCDDGVVVKGEYGLSTVLLANGFNLGTLMSRYRSGVDWRQVSWQKESRHDRKACLDLPVLLVVLAKFSAWAR